MVQGENLEERPRPDHITEAEEELLGERSKLPGRWVDAGDLRPGDLLFLRDGRQVAINAVQPFREHQVTYNFAVDDLHCYAVGQNAVLVHNSCGDDRAELLLKFGDDAVNKGIHISHKTGAGAARTRRHHIFPQKYRQWFADRGISIDRYTVEIDQGAHSALHTMQWNENMMSALFRREVELGRPLTAREIWTVGYRQMRVYMIDQLTIIRY